MVNIRDELAQIVDDVAEQATREGRIASPLDVSDAILARYGVVELPEERDDGLGSVQWNVDSRDDLARVRLNHRRQIVSDSVSNPARDAAAARSHAAALLAAANRNECPCETRMGLRRMGERVKSVSTYDFTGTIWIRKSDNAEIRIEADSDRSGSTRRSLRATSLETGRQFWVTPEGLRRKYAESTYE